MRYRGSVSSGCFYFFCDCFLRALLFKPQFLSQLISQSVAGRNKCVFQHCHELLKNSPPRKKFSHRNTHTLTAHIQPCRRMQQAALYNQLLTRTSDLLEPLGRKLETETIVFNFSPVSLLLLLPFTFFSFLRKTTALLLLRIGIFTSWITFFFRSFGLAACCALPTCSCVASSC